MLPTLVRRIAATSVLHDLRSTPIVTKLAGTYDGRSKLKKVWPPDFSKLSEKEKFRFERRYKRRVKLASARPRWDKFMRLVQLVSVTSVLIYTVLFMNWGQEKHPFHDTRVKFWNAIGFPSPEQRQKQNLDTQPNIHPK
ncbi:uncharacterized protein GGS25DRAFT_520087 [Hypoxylon fragiforme]|uniref:uncharacterized protein n=1 Tax=Hypoxylon fragiforme TaxID=63214 RepID=UPI0020C618FF|nr:uncharacterized protein GGS25DRAFT_520087 [Hypoxylon fragiforme]KAI2611776.1 hypothetical protein GGS25DRAFT_520087 [Hypoxylon fragiforme]